MKKIIFFLFGFTVFCTAALSQNIGIKTNLAYWATTTPNIGLELTLNHQYTLEIAGGFNPFTFSNSKKLQHWLIQPEFRYWTRETYNGHFLGLHALVGEYNAGGVGLSLGRLKKLKKYRYEGFGYGAGVSYGYQWVLGKSLNLEANLGVGYVYFTYDKFPCVKCGEKLSSTSNHYLGVTKVGVSLIYFIK